MRGTDPKNGKPVPVSTSFGPGRGSVGRAAPNGAAPHAPGRDGARGPEAGSAAQVAEPPPALAGGTRTGSHAGSRAQGCAAPGQTLAPQADGVAPAIAGGCQRRAQESRPSPGPQARLEGGKAPVGPVLPPDSPSDCEGHGGGNLLAPTSCGGAIGPQTAPSDGGAASPAASLMGGVELSGRGGGGGAKTSVPILDNRHRIPSNVLVPLPFSSVYTNARMKLDPNTGEVVQIVLASRPIFKSQDVEALEKPQDVEALEKPQDVEALEKSQEVEAIEEAENSPAAGAPPDSLRRAAARAKARLFDLCRYNAFDTFITLTLNDGIIDGFDYKAAVKKLGEWCDNRVRRRGLRYIIVPEKHPTSGRIHFHGLINSEAVKLEASRRPSGRLRKDKHGRQVYNVTDWGYGFTTAVLLDGSYEAVCHYVAKYMTKQENAEARGTLTGRYFYHGGELKEPGYIYFNATSADDLGEEVYRIEIEEAGLTLRFFRP